MSVSLFYQARTSVSVQHRKGIRQLEEDSVLPSHLLEPAPLLTIIKKYKMTRWNANHRKHKKKELLQTNFQTFDAQCLSACWHTSLISLPDILQSMFRTSQNSTTAYCIRTSCLKWLLNSLSSRLNSEKCIDSQFPINQVDSTVTRNYRIVRT